MSTWYIQPLATEGLPPDKRPKERCWAVYDGIPKLRAVFYDHAHERINGSFEAECYARSRGHEVRFHVGERLDVLAATSAEVNS